MDRESILCHALDIQLSGTQRANFQGCLPGMETNWNYWLASWASDLENLQALIFSNTNFLLCVPQKDIIFFTNYVDSERHYFIIMGCPQFVQCTTLRIQFHMRKWPQNEIPQAKVPFFLQQHHAPIQSWPEHCIYADINVQICKAVYQGA